MLFNSWQFLIFFPVTVLLYYVVPGRLKNICLLLANCIFYGSAGLRGLLVLLLCGIWTYAASLLIEAARGRGKRILKTVLGISLGGLFLTLAGFKYAGFVLHNLFALVRMIKPVVQEPTVSIIMPVGISFFVFQMAGYLIDVYRTDLKAERRFLHLLLFVTFFPQLLAGPIPRGKDLLPQFDSVHHWDYERFVDGSALMLWGFVLKLVIADRAAILVDTVYDQFSSYTGAVLILATLMFALQIYCDFYGYSLIARGAARILGFELAENFAGPYLAVSVQDFWRRWHISLSSWFRDYLYIPLGGSRQGRGKKYRNILLVFLVSGLWHGAQWNFVCWGLLNGLYQVLEDAAGRHGKQKGEHEYRSAQKGRTHFPARVRTIIMICAAWVFFEARGLRAAVRMLLQMCCLIRPAAPEGMRIMGLSSGVPGISVPEFILLVLGGITLLLADISREKGTGVYARICKAGWVWRPVILAAGVILLAVTGIWGNAYQASGFIYFQF